MIYTWYRIERLAPKRYVITRTCKQRTDEVVDLRPTVFSTMKVFHLRLRGHLTRPMKAGQMVNPTKLLKRHLLLGAST